MIFLNILQLERQGADLQTKIEELRIINQSLRENDKVKEDNALAHLSDQLFVLSEKIYTTVRKKTICIILSKLIEKRSLLASIQKPIGIFTVDGNRKGQYHQ